MHDAPQRAFYHHLVEHGAHAAVDPLSMTIPCATPSLQYDAAAQVFAPNFRYSVRYYLRLRNSPIDKSIITLLLWVARRDLTSCGDEKTKRGNGVIGWLEKREMSFGLKVKGSLQDRGRVLDQDQEAGIERVQRIVRRLALLWQFKERIRLVYLFIRTAKHIHI